LFYFSPSSNQSMIALFALFLSHFKTGLFAIDIFFVFFN